MPNRITGGSNTVKKQLNDMWLSFSYDVHKDLYSLSVDAFPSGTSNYASGTAYSGTACLGFNAIQGTKLWEGQTLNADAGEEVLFVVRSPLGRFPVQVDVPIVGKRRDDTTFSGTVTIDVGAYAGKNQATYLAESATAAPLKVTRIGSVAQAGGIVVRNANVGDNFKFIAVPARDTFRDQSYVRAITPNIPKDYTEVADHFDGAADVIRTTVINGLTISKVFEDVPGSFMMMQGRTVTFKADMRELDRSVASEEYLFTGVRGTGRVTFNRDGESITEFEASMLDWITISG